MKLLFTQPFFISNLVGFKSLRGFYLLSALICLPILVEKTSPLEKSIEKFVKYEIDLQEVKGLVIGAIDGENTVTLGFGETEIGNETSPGGNTIFEIGSCTKLFTASIIAILKEEKLLSYEDDVSKYLDKLYFKGKDITILDLLTHTSGFTRYPSNFTEDEKKEISPIESYTYPQFAKFLQTYQSIPSKDRNYIYSHTNYILLTLIIEKITQQRYETVVKEKLLEPLGMNDTKIILSENDKQRMAQGHDLTGKPTRALETTVFKGAIAFKSTPNDMLKFIQTQLQSKDETLIQTLHLMHETAIPTNIKKISSGIGWHHVKPKKNYYTILAHSGMSHGHQTYIAFLKETQTAVVIMANSKNSLDGAGSYLLEMMNKGWKRKN